MKILAIDTSSKICGVCLLEDGKEILKKNIETDKSHSIKLMPFIKEIFQNVNFELKDIDLIVCDKGPGSFTGIRIGVATAKSFADSLNKVVIGVSSLEALAYSIGKGFVCPMLDARNNNCYTALYKFENDRCIEVVSPFSDNSKQAINKILQYSNNQPISYIKDESSLDAYYLGLAGYKKYLDGNIDSCLPMYLKKPQAQRQLEEKQLSTK